jgi:hypothetical protein
MKNKMAATKCFIILFALMLGFKNTHAQTLPNSPYAAGTDLDLVAAVGQLVLGNGYNMVHAPFGEVTYWHILSMRHENYDNNFTTQIAGEFFGNRLAFRNTQNVLNTTWNELYHSGNINTLKTALANSGNIGIGINTPETKLHISSTHTTNGITVGETGSTAKQLIMGYDITANYGGIQAVHQNTSGRPLILNLIGGNVGIGLSNPTDRLAVNGTVHAKEVRVDLTGWPDYVFKPNYNLKSLPELKNYIDGHGRLPDMPSEREVEANGVKLGEMNKLLLKKIEELTLYLIEKDKQLTDQQIYNKQQNQRLLTLEKTIFNLTKK